MKEPLKNVRDYLAAIGKRGGLTSRRELTRSHARPDGRDPRSETRGFESRKAVASSRPQTVKAQVMESDLS